MVELLLEVAVEKEMNVLSVKDSRKFEVHCRAGDAGELCVGAESVSVKVGQRLRREGGKKSGIQSESTPRKRMTALSSFKFWCLIRIGMKRANRQHQIAANRMEVVTRLWGVTWTM